MTKPADAKSSRDSLRRHSTNALERIIENQRAKLSQAHAVLKCLYEVLLHAEGPDAVSHAEAAHLAARLLDESLERLDPQRLRSLIEGTKSGEAYKIAEEKVTATANSDEGVRDGESVRYLH